MIKTDLRPKPRLTFHLAWVFPLLMAVGFTVYHNTLQASFQFDDHGVILGNPKIQDPWNWPVLWDEFNTRFITGLTLALNYTWSEYDTLSYHVFNTTIHILSATGIFVLSWRLFDTPLLLHSPAKQRRLFICLAASLLFLCHPLQPAAVTYIWQRAASMAGCCYIIAVALYIDSRVRNSVLTAAASWLVALVGMFVKEHMVTFPVMLYCIEYLVFKQPLHLTQQRWLRLMPYLCLLPIIPLTYGRMAHIDSRHFTPPSAEAVHEQDPSSGQRDLDITRWVTEEEMPRNHYYLTQSSVLLSYLRMFAWPTGLTLDYDYPIATTFWKWRTGLSFVALMALAVGLIRYHRKWPLLAYALVWYFLTLSIETIVPFKDVIYNYRMYLPMAILCILVPYTLAFIVQQQRYAIPLMSLFIITCAWFTIQRNEAWRSPITLWSDCIEKSPHKPRPHNNLGMAYLDQGDLDNARHHFAICVELDPNYAQALNNLGSVYSRKGDAEQALCYYKLAAERKPNYTQALYNIARQYHVLNQTNNALNYYQQVLYIDANYAPALNNAALLCQQNKAYDQALHLFRLLLKINPNNPDALASIGIIYYQQDNTTAAIDTLHQALILQPNHSPSHINLGAIYIKQKKLQLAEQHFKQALIGDSNNATAHNNLGVVYRRQKKYAQAIDHFQTALKLDPNNKSARQNLLETQAHPHTWTAGHPLGVSNYFKLKKSSRDQLPEK